VGDEHQRGLRVGDQPAQQLEDLRGDRDVEGGRRLVGDEQPREQASAMAIMTRCRMPPESWCG
jgi:hypothetical protein